MTEALELPLRTPTPGAWADLAAGRLDEFLADHAVCEQQAALFALNLVAHYPDDDELVRKMTALAAEEVAHLRRVTRLLHDRGWKVSRRRSNPYVQGLHRSIGRDREPELKVDRLLVGALIEARSCERFTCLLERLRGVDPEASALLEELGPAEKRHWLLFHGLASRETEPATLGSRWAFWLDRDAELMRSLGVSPTVHG